MSNDRHFLGDFPYIDALFAGTFHVTVLVNSAVLFRCELPHNARFNRGIVRGFHPRFRSQDPKTIDISIVSISRGSHN